MAHPDILDRFSSSFPTHPSSPPAAYFEDVIVGSVCCRVDTDDAGDQNLYIMTLGCLAPYRRHGIGLCPRLPVPCIHLHTHVHTHALLWLLPLVLSVPNRLPSAGSKMLEHVLEIAKKKPELATIML